MAIVTNIGTLKQELQSYLYDRLDLADKLPSFIDMAQKRIFRVLQCRENEAQFTSPLPSSGYPVPTDYVSLKYLLVNGTPMTSITARRLKSLVSDAPAVGLPTSFARVNDAFQFHPQRTRSMMSSFTTTRTYPLTSPTTWPPTTS